MTITISNLTFLVQFQKKNAIRLSQNLKSSAIFSGIGLKKVECENNYLSPLSISKKNIEKDKHYSARIAPPPPRTDKNISIIQPGWKKIPQKDPTFFKFFVFCFRKRGRKMLVPLLVLYETEKLNVHKKSNNGLLLFFPGRPPSGNFPGSILLNFHAYENENQKQFATGALSI